MAEPPPAKPEYDKDILRDQWGHVIESLRFIVGLMLQVWTFLAAADTALLAFGIAKRNQHWALYVAAAMPAVMAAVGVVVSRLMSPLIYVGLVTESKLNVPAPFVASYTHIRTPEFSNFVNEQDRELMGNLPTSGRGPVKRHLILTALGLGALLQLALAVVVTLTIR